MSDENTKQQTFEYVSNAEMKEKWGLKDNVSPQELPLEQINPGNNDWFARNQEIEVFDRLRKEDPVHFTADSQFGSYWSCLLYTSPSPRDS